MKATSTLASSVRPAASARNLDSAAARHVAATSHLASLLTSGPWLRYGAALQPGEYRTAYKPLARIDENKRVCRRAEAGGRLSERLYTASWLDSSKTNAVNLLANFCEAAGAKCMRQPKARHKGSCNL